MIIFLKLFTSSYAQHKNLLLLWLGAAVLISCSREPINYDWFQGEWISSIAETASNSINSNAPTDSSVGKLIWSVQTDRLFITDHALDFQQDSLFDVETVSESEFRLHGMGLDDYIITKTELGFCAEPYGIASELITLACFVPYR